MLGFGIGAVSGAAQFWLLSKFTGSVTSGKFSSRTVLFAVFQFFLPLAVLLCCALLLFESLIWTGIGMAASLIICAAIRFFSAGR